MFPKGLFVRGVKSQGYVVKSELTQIKSIFWNQLNCCSKDKVCVLNNKKKKATTLYEREEMVVISIFLIFEAFWRRIMKSELYSNG